MKPPFELIFTGPQNSGVLRYRRGHRNLESARFIAQRVWEEIQIRRLPVAKFKAVIYGPGCGAKGILVQPCRLVVPSASGGKRGAPKGHPGWGGRPAAMVPCGWCGDPFPKSKLPGHYDECPKNPAKSIGGL